MAQDLHANRRDLRSQAHGTRGWKLFRPARRAGALLTSLALALGGVVAGTTAASAAPSDPITMPDDVLRACVNAELGHASADPITEAQAVTVTTVDCQSEGVTDLSGMEHFTTLETAWLNNNPVIASMDPLANLATVRQLGLNNAGVSATDLAALSQLTSLTFLGLSSNDISDLSVVANFSDLESLSLRNNAITDLSDLAGLTDLTYLSLSNNGINDVSDLAGLSNLEYLYLNENDITDLSPLPTVSLTTFDATNQAVDLGDLVVDEAAANPVTDRDGDPVALDDLYDTGANTFTPTALGAGSIGWDDGNDFTGTLSFTAVEQAVLITMPDDALRACVNAELGQTPTDPITEAQAATVTTVDCQNAGVTDLTGMEHFTAVETAWFAVNSDITDLTPLSGLTTIESLDLRATGIADDDMPALSQLANLESLSMGDNDISDMSVLSNFSGLIHFYAGLNDISDVSALAGLTDLRLLYLAENEITDVSALAGLTNLTDLYLNDQTVRMPTATVNSTTPNPVTDVSGDAVVVSSSEADFSYNATPPAWSFSTIGTKDMAWNTSVSVGNVAAAQFSGMISQRISPAEVTPEIPEVTQAVCANGDVVGPRIALPDTEGVDYAIDGTVAPGETVTVQATPTENHRLVLEPGTGWTGSSDGIYAELVIVLAEVECDPVDPGPTVIDAPNGDLPVDDPCGPDNATWILPTGDDVPEGFSWVVDDDGLLTAVTKAGYVFSDPTGDMDPNRREYGYAPDTNESCQVDTDTPGDEDTLAATGGPGLNGAIAAGTLLGIGGLLLLLARQRHNA